MKAIYLIDASGWIYRSYFAIRNMTNSKGESTNALYGFIRSVMKLMKDFNPDFIVSVFDGPRNGIKREAIYPQYKAHRKEMPQDLRYQIEWAHRFCDLMGIPQLNIPEVEADDVMGSVAKFTSQQGAKTYLCTSDKDFCQLVDDKIFLLNTHKDNLVIDVQGVEKIYGVLPQQMIDYLAIIGDASDNIPGLPGLGPKSATDLLKNFGSLDYILEHPKEIPGAKKQEIITKEKDLALLSKKLVTIDLHVDIPKDLQFYHLRTTNRSELKEFYKQMNFNSLIKELDSLQVPGVVVPIEEEVHCHLVDDESSFQTLLLHLLKQKEICFHAQTTDPHPLQAKLTGIGFATDLNSAWYVPLNGQLGFQKVIEGLRPVFENSNISFYGHNLKYNYHVLTNHGIKIQRLSFDTILASYILNSHQRQHSLDFLLLEYFGKVKKTSLMDLLGKGQKQIGISEVPIDRVCAYSCEEVNFTLKLKHVLEKQLEERKLGKLLTQLELPLLLVLARMEREGIYIDIPLLKNMSEQISHEIRVLENDIYSMAGSEFNINSPLQLKKMLFEKLAIPFPKRSKETSTGEEILDLLKSTYPITGKILEYRKLEKLRSTYVDALPQEVDETTNRIHCTFNQSVAATGRLSCQNPNLQNIPIRTELGSKIREAFRPEKKGWSFLAADYSQIELRLLAHMSEDPDMMQAFHHNEDIHAHTAAAIYNISLKEVTKIQRYSAKAVNFGIVYGQQAFGLSQVLNISTSEASHFIETYFKRFGKVKNFIENCKEQARKTGRSVTMTGRERLIPEINSKNGMIRSQAERLAINTPLQGTAADLIKRAMIEIDTLLKKQQALGYMILQIHDELIFEVPDFEIITLQPLIKNAMEQVFKLKVPLIVDIAIGKNWKEC